MNPSADISNKKISAMTKRFLVELQSLMDTVANEPDTTDMTTCVARGTYKDGRSFQIHLKVTTDDPIEIGYGEVVL